jgi:thiol-disulfide isomerase/thioredoxin
MVRLSLNPDSDVQKQSPLAGKPRLRRWMGELLIVLLVLAAVQWWQTRNVVSGPAPILVGELLDGGHVDLHADLDRPVLVHFWAEWCPICRLEQGSIDALAEDYRVISVATTSGDAAEVRAHMQREGLRFPVLLDEEGAIARAWGVSGVPASFVIDPAGRVAHAMVGYTSGIGFRVRLWLAAL